MIYVAGTGIEMSLVIDATGRQRLSEQRYIRLESSDDPSFYVQVLIDEDVASLVAGQMAAEDGRLVADAEPEGPEPANVTRLPTTTAIPQAATQAARSSAGDPNAVTEGSTTTHQD